MKFLIFLCCARLLLAYAIGTPVEQEAVYSYEVGDFSYATDDFSYATDDFSYATDDFPYAMVVNKNTFMPANNNPITWNGLLVNKPYNLSMEDCRMVLVIGEINNQGGLYVSSKKEWIVFRSKADVFKNSGSLVMNLMEGDDGWDSSCVVYASVSFNNTGELKFFTRDTESLLPYEIIANNFYNGGVISVFCAPGVPAKTLNMQPKSDLNGITNNGSVCMHNYWCQQLSDIHGSGCISLHAGSQYLVQGTNGLSRYLWDPKQQVALFDNSTVAFSGFNSDWEGRILQIWGFGGDSRIRFYDDISQPGFVYDQKEGRIDWEVAGRPSLQIGPGYDASKFVLEGSFLRYDGPAPDAAIPDLCQCDFTVPTPIV